VQILNVVMFQSYAALMKRRTKVVFGSGHHSCISENIGFSYRKFIALIASLVYLHGSTDHQVNNVFSPSFLSHFCCSLPLSSAPLVLPQPCSTLTHSSCNQAQV